MSTLIIFCKDPVIGQVKTRLGRKIGMQQAQEVYISMLELVVNTVKKFEPVLYIDGKKTFFEKYGLRLEGQTGSNLGRRMFEAICQELERDEKVVLIGSDVPDWNVQDIESAFSLLDSHDIVLGPAQDGGYYLVGMNKKHDIFELKKWSHSNVLNETLVLCEKKGLSVALLREKRDVDRKEDLQVLKEKKLLGFLPLSLR